MATLEDLGKQAKLFVHWHRDRYYPVAQQIRAMLPRFKDMTDREVLDSAFDLSDAHELIARQWGFQGWQALSEGLQDTTESPKAVSPPFLMNVEAQLFVADVRASCDFFAAKLGFEIGFTYGEPPFYGQGMRDNALLNLRLVCEPVYVGDIRERKQPAGGLDDRRQHRRAQAPLRAVSSCRRRLLPAAQTRATGRPYVRRARSRRQSLAVRLADPSC